MKVNNDRMQNLLVKMNVNVERGFQEKNINKFYIYGLGTSGKLFIDLYKTNGIILNKCFVGFGFLEYNFYNGIEVCDDMKVENFTKECAIIYTVKQDKQIVLEGKDLKNVLVIDISSTQIYRNMLHIFYNDYFKRYNIREDGEKIVWGECSILNPRIISDECYETYLTEIGDILLPSILNDYSRVDEGAYEIAKCSWKMNEGVIFDCGANIGLFSALAASYNNVVYAFEPSEETRKYLKCQSDLYPNKIIVQPYALSDRCGESTLYFDGESAEASMFADNEKQIKAEKINTITIDKFVEKNEIYKVDFIKADIEGAERLLLEGAQMTLKEFHPMLSICTYHNMDDKKVLEQLILKANSNYKVVHKWKKLFAYC